jgi:uncharacterized protein with PQ loop repeat
VSADVFVLLGYLGSALGVVMVLPQIVRVLRSPHAGGVSALSWALTATCCLLWFMYGVRTAQPVQLVGNAFLITGAVVIALAVPSMVRAGWRVSGLGLAGAATVALGLALPGQAVGFAAFGLGLFSTWPQVATSVRTFRARSASGVSIGTFALKALSQSCWLLFAIGTRDSAVTVAALMALSTALLVIGLERAARAFGSDLAAGARAS